MRKQSWIGLGLALFLPLGLVDQISGATSSSDELRIAVEKMRREVEQERDLTRSDAERQAAWESGNGERLKALRDQAKRAAHEVDSLDRQKRLRIGSKENEVVQVEKEQARFKSLGIEVAILADSLAVEMERRELPALAEKKAPALREIARGLRAELMPPEEGLSRLFDLMAALLDEGSLVTVEAGSFTSGKGLSAPGHYIRAGGVFEAFVGSDGVFGAYRVRDEKGWAWRETLTGDRREALAKVVRMVARTEKPGFVAIPLGLAGGEP